MIKSLIYLPLKLYIYIIFIFIYVINKRLRHDLDNLILTSYLGKFNIISYLKILSLNRDFVEILKIRGAKFIIPSFIFGVTSFKCFMPSNKIGKGLVLHHPYLTRINCKKIGDNVQIWQMVTIGKSKPTDGLKFTPSIGNRVKLSTGCVIVGNIVIGNDVTVGANCVITKDVPDGYTLIGNPAIVIKIFNSKIIPFYL